MTNTTTSGTTGSCSFGGISGFEYPTASEDEGGEEVNSSPIKPTTSGGVNTIAPTALSTFASDNFTGDAVEPQVGQKRKRDGDGDDKVRLDPKMARHVTDTIAKVGELNPLFEDIQTKTRELLQSRESTERALNALTEVIDIFSPVERASTAPSLSPELKTLIEDSTLIQDHAKKSGRDPQDVKLSVGTSGQGRLLINIATGGQAHQNNENPVLSKANSVKTQLEERLAKVNGLIDSFAAFESKATHHTTQTILSAGIKHFEDISPDTGPSFVDKLNIENKLNRAKELLYSEGSLTHEAKIAKYDLERSEPPKTGSTVPIEKFVHMHGENSPAVRELVKGLNA